MMKKIRRSLSLNPADRKKLRTSLYEDTYPGDPPEIGEYPVKGNAELPDHMKPFSGRATRAPPPPPKPTTRDTAVYSSPPQPPLKSDPQHMRSIPQQLAGRQALPVTPYPSPAVLEDPRVARSRDSRSRTSPQDDITSSRDMGDPRVEPSVLRGTQVHDEPDLSKGLSNLSLNRGDGKSHTSASFLLQDTQNIHLTIE